MSNVTVRLTEELLADAKRAAALDELSLNGWVVRLIRTAVDPEHEPDARARMREKFRKAGILSEVPYRYIERPDPAELRAAQEELAKGTPLSDIVSENRGPY